MPKTEKIKRMCDFGMKEMKQILIVEDDIELNKGLCKALEAEDRKLIACTDLKTAGEQVLFGGIDLILLDINLPDGNGMGFLAEIKKNFPGISVVLLTANDTDIDIVNGLESGADDYITKPFSLSVLRARVNTQLRKKTGEEAKIIKTGRFSFDFTNQKFWTGEGLTELSKTEQKLLYIMVSNQGNILTRERLIEYVWNRSDFIDENSLSVAVKRLRDKLKAVDTIQTIYGIGYRWEKL